MANLNNALFKDRMTVKTTGFDRLDELLTRLEDTAEKMPENLLKDTKEDALAMSRELSTNFQNAIARLPDRERKDLPVFTTYITNIRGGYNIAIAGKDIWYYEFGTGDQGERSGYPKKALENRNYKYNAGPKVIHKGEADDWLSFQELPAWYIGFINKNKGARYGNWWMSPHGISNGIPAGKFFYDTVRDFKDSLTSDEEEMGYELSRHSIHLKVRDAILKGKKWR